MIHFLTLFPFHVLPLWEGTTTTNVRGIRHQYDISHGTRYAQYQSFLSFFELNFQVLFLAHLEKFAQQHKVVFHGVGS